MRFKVVGHTATENREHCQVNSISLSQQANESKENNSTCQDLVRKGLVLDFSKPIAFDIVPASSCTDS